MSDFQMCAFEGCQGTPRYPDGMSAPQKSDGACGKEKSIRFVLRSKLTNDARMQAGIDRQGPSSIGL